MRLQSAHPQHSRSDQLLDLLGDAFVFHDVVDSFGVSFQIGQSVSNLGGLQDGLDFGISHRPLGSLFLVLRVAAHVDSCLRLFDSLSTEFIFRISLQASFKTLQSFVVLLHEEVAVSLFVVGLLEGRVFFEGKFVVFLGSLELHQLDVDLTDVAVKFGIVWVSADCLLVLLEGLRELS